MILILLLSTGNPLHPRHKRGHNRETAQTANIPYRAVHKVQIVQADQRGERHQIPRRQGVGEGSQGDV